MSSYLCNSGPTSDFPFPSRSVTDLLKERVPSGFCGREAGKAVLDVNIGGLKLCLSLSQCGCINMTLKASG